MILRHLSIRYELRQAGGDPFGSFSHLPRFAPREWRPPCDVYETRTEWVVRAEIAGLDERELEVLLYEDGLLVKGRRDWSPLGGERDELRVHTAEIRYGPFKLALGLPQGLERERASGSYERGLLVIRVPRRGVAS